MRVTQRNLVMGLVGSCTVKTKTCNQVPDLRLTRYTPHYNSVLIGKWKKRKVKIAIYSSRDLVCCERMKQKASSFYTLTEDPEECEGSLWLSLRSPRWLAPQRLDTTSMHTWPLFLATRMGKLPRKYGGRNHSTAIVSQKREALVVWLRIKRENKEFSNRICLFGAFNGKIWVTEIIHCDKHGALNNCRMEPITRIKEGKWTIASL